MTVTAEKYMQSANAVKERIGDINPEVLLILGSGLGGLADEVKNAVEMPYSEIPNFEVSTAPGHSGKLVCGKLGGKQVMVMSGRMHYYEGYGYDKVTLPVRVAKLLGADKMIVTNASGGINESYNVGDLMLIADHIKLVGDSPLRGENIDELGPRFPDMTYAYSKRLRALAKEVAEEMNITLREGVYYYAMGPQYETPAEIRAMRVLGADVVGMSTAPEAIAASHCGMETLGISLVSNMASGILDKPLTSEEVIEAGEKAKDVFGTLVVKCLERM